MKTSDHEIILQRISEVERQITHLRKQQEGAESTLISLRESLASSVVETPHKPEHPAETPASAAISLTPDEKITLFLRLFQGREDVYPKLWQNQKTGKKGYSPACSNEWIRGVCEKPRVKCDECPNQAFLPVTSEVILDHLQGRHVIGVYPMFKNETCRFIAADFDKEAWREDVMAFTETCRHTGVPYAIERSRSGNGAHVWFFFNCPVPAATARKMGSYLITKTISRRHQLSMASYDRLFPNQDTLPKGGFGNLIALPLQYHPRQDGNTVFLDDELDPFPDQWEFLSSLVPIQMEMVDKIAMDATTRGLVTGLQIAITEEDVDVSPWLKSPSRKSKHIPITDTVPRQIRFKVDPRSQSAQHPCEHRLVVRETGFDPPEQASELTIQELYGLLVTDEKRNEQIIDDVFLAMEEGRSPILLTERKNHLEHLHQRLKGFVPHIVVLKGGRSTKERLKVQEQLASIPIEEERLLLATGRYIGEGFDDARLDTLFLSLPVSWKGTLVQYAGRLHRLHPGKREVRIVDYVDSKVPMLARMFEKRRVGYRAMGYQED